MCFVTAGMGGGTGTGAAPVVARPPANKGILTVGVVTKPFHFEGQRRMRTCRSRHRGAAEVVDTLIVIPNQNLFRMANDKTTFADAFAMADQVLYSGVACITDLMVKEGLINLDFADVRSVMREMGKAMMGTGEASGEGRAMAAAEAAIANPLLDETSMKGAQGPADLDHRRPRPDPVRSRRSRNPYPRGSRSGRQHHPRRNLRRRPRRRHPRVGRCHRHRPRRLPTWLLRNADHRSQQAEVRHSVSRSRHRVLSCRLLLSNSRAWKCVTSDPVAEQPAPIRLPKPSVPRDGAAAARPLRLKRLPSAEQAVCRSARPSRSLQHRISRSAVPAASGSTAAGCPGSQSCSTAVEPADPDASGRFSRRHAHAEDRGLSADGEGRDRSQGSAGREQHEDRGPMGLLKRLTSGLDPP
jgi:cell division protein FtsZ